MKKLTKKFIIKEMSPLMLKNERIVDIDIRENGKSARIITITKNHVPMVYIMLLKGTRVITYFNILMHDTNDTFEKPISVKYV